MIFDPEELVTVISAEGVGKGVLRGNEIIMIEEEGKMDVIRIQSAVVQRQEDSPRENAIMINDDGLLIDMQGQVITAPVWNYSLSYDLAVTLKMDSPRQKGMSK